MIGMVLCLNLTLDGYAASSDYETLQAAEKIIIQTDYFSMNKSYHVSVNGEKVGDIDGKYFPLFGDTLTFEDSAGNVIGSERQIKRWNIKLNRLAEVLDEDNKTVGYIGEKVIQNFFNLGYTFHFYDAKQNELATARENVFRLFDEYVIYDNESQPLYKIKQKFSLFNRKYEITVYESDTIPVEQSLYLTCILDAIKQADKDKE